MFHLPTARRLGARRYAIRNLGQGRRYLADPIHSWEPLASRCEVDDGPQGQVGIGDPWLS